MKTYTIHTKFVFEGDFTIKANNKQEAKEAIEKHCGLVLGGDIHTTYNDDLINWNFKTHPTKIISPPRISEI